MSRVRRSVLIALLFAGCFLGGQPWVQAQEAPLKGLDEYVAKAMRDWEIPGLAIAIVKDDKIVLAKGYGVRKLGDKAAVDAYSLFAIASNTKAFTAAALGILVDEGKIKWDDPVTKHLPGFQMHDPYVTRELTVRDLLCHRSGLERHDLLWVGHPEWSRQDMMARMRHIKPTWSFRSKYGYQNLMFLVAGQIVPQVTGKSWDDFLKERFFAPLGMVSTSTSVSTLNGRENVASPHQKIDGKVQVVPYRNIDNMGPAGSINSNVTDMAQWLRLQLNQGLLEKKRLLSTAVIKEMQSPQMIIPKQETVARLLPDSQFLAYGLGFMMLDYRGRKVIQHGGSLPGMISQVFLVPEEKLGVVVLTNFRFNALPMALPYRILDAYLGGETKDWSARTFKIWQGMEKKRLDAEAKEDKARVAGTKPSLPLKSYAGTFKDTLWGEVKVALEKDKLTVTYGPGMVGTLEHWHYDTFRVDWQDPTIGRSRATFNLNAEGKVGEITITVTGARLTARMGAE
jgi:CubicO group peptidase (beta-lactamase class C family)